MGSGQHKKRKGRGRSRDLKVEEGEKIGGRRDSRKRKMLFWGLWGLLPGAKKEKARERR